MTFAAQGGSTYELPLRMNRAGTKITGGVIEGNQLKIVFPAGTGYQRATVSW